MTDTVTDETTETPAEPEERLPCLCGCGGIPTRKRSRFLPGHDAQMKARLYRVIRDNDATDEAKAEAVETLDRFGWPQPAPKRAKAVKAENGDSEAPAES